MQSGVRTAIFTDPGDYHAHAVRWSMLRKGHVCELIYFSDLPQVLDMTFTPTDYYKMTVSGTPTLHLADYDRFWVRRFVDPILPPNIHPADRRIANGSWRSMISAAFASIGRSGRFCINAPPGGEIGMQKPLQLEIAHSCGLLIPNTLITSCSSAARNFIRENRIKGYGTVLKGLITTLWDLGNEGMAILETVRVDESEIGDSLRLTPSIFQMEIRKSFEVRVLVLGHEMIAAKIDSQGNENTSLDYRRASDWRDLGCDVINIPMSVQRSILAFQARASLNFGVMDFIVTRSDEWVFLETNPSGQFLWVEHANPSALLLDRMSEFLISGDNEFRYKVSQPPVKPHRLTDYERTNCEFEADIRREWLAHPRVDSAIYRDTSLG